MAWIYGKPCVLTEYGWEGFAPDGTVRPGADLEFMVTFDQVTAGCGDLGCNPGADIVWSATGHTDTQHVGMQNSQRCGFCDTYRVIAPQSGTMIVSAKSANTITWTVTVSATDTQAGQVKITSLASLSQENYGGECKCAGNYITMYFTSTPTSVGNGMAYYDVLVNGALVVENGVTSSNEQHRDSVTIPCPLAGSTITIRGKNDTGASIVTSAGTIVKPGETYCDNNNIRCIGGRYLSWCTDPQGAGSWQDKGVGTCTTGGTCARECTKDFCDATGIKFKCAGGCAVSTGEKCVPPVVDVPVSTDPLAVLIDFYNKNKMMSILGIALLGGFVVFRK